MSTCDRIVPYALRALRQSADRSFVLVLGTVAMGLVLVEVSKQRIDVRRGIPEIEVLGLDEALVYPALDLRPERVEVSIQIQHHHRLRMEAELLQGQRLQDLLEGAEPTGKRDEGVAPLVHDGLAVA